ncbi:MAG: DNA alkylation repair protein [bacterium]
MTRKPQKPRTLKDLVRELRANANAKKAEQLAGYFKTGLGEYGAGDRFLGLTVPQQRTIARAYSHLSFADLTTLAKNPIHEHRFTCTEILNQKMVIAMRSPNGAAAKLPQPLVDQEQIAKWYIEHARCFNNWDLVDNSARDILGAYLHQKGNTAILDRLARSANLWERRIAVIATHFFIQKGEFADTLRICETLIGDDHDLIHKACGWMLRETGKRSPEGLKALKSFLGMHAVSMPRTMLRYAIERFSASQRAKYLKMA